MFPADRAMTSLMQEVPVSAEPPRTLGIAIALDEITAVRVLVVGGTLPDEDDAALRKAGSQIAVALSLLDAFQVMASKEFDVVAVHPHIRGDKDGLRFARALKAPPSKTIDELAESVKARLADVPFVVLPASGRTEYVLTLGGAWFATSTDRLPLCKALCGAKQLLAKS